jgi:hypothetical protein
MRPHEVHTELIGDHREMSSTDLYARMCVEKEFFTPTHPYEYVTR